MRPDIDTALDEAVLDLERPGDIVRGSIEVVREKQVDDDIVVAVTYRRRQRDDVRRGCAGLAWSPRYGWHSGGGAWSSTARDGPPRGIWLNWGGWGPGTGGQLVVRAGWLAHPTAHTLVVTDTVGRVVEDTVENGVAILTWRGDFSVERATAELRDADGQVITSELFTPRRR